MQRLLSCMLLVLCVGSVSGAMASDTLEFGETVTGTISTPDESTYYTFAGQADDIVLIIFGDTSFTGELYNVTLELYAPDGELLASAEGFSEVELAARLPEEGEYALVGSAETPGDFSLLVLQPKILEPGDSVRDHVRSNAPAYYAIVIDDTFSLNYERLNGDFRPEIRIYMMSDLDMGLVPVGMLAGLHATGGTLNLEPDEDCIYIIALKESAFDFNLSEVEAEYLLTIG